MADEVVATGSQAGLPQEPPRGSKDVTIDEKGRLRIPAPIVGYIKSLGDTSVYIACVNSDTARVYPMSVWRANERKFDELQPNPEAAERLEAFIKLTQYTGGVADIDGSGRAMLPPQLREMLGFTPKSEAWMTFVMGAFDLETDAVLSRKRAAMMSAMDNKGLSVVRSLGVK